MAPSHKSDERVYDSESGSDYEDVAFEAPKGFKKVPLKAPDSLGDKEIWLLKTPKGFPLDKLKTLPVSFTSRKVKNDGVKPVVVDNTKYQVNEEHFSSDNAKYAIVNKELRGKHIDRYYTIREVVDIPKIDFEAVTVPRVDVEKAEGLKMRHFATGYGAKDFEEAQPIAELRLDEDGRVIKKARVEEKKADKKEEKKEKKDKKDKKDKKEKKEKKDKKEKKKKAQE